jgi:hypothetical protein
MFHVIVDWRYGVHPMIVGAVECLLEDLNLGEEAVQVVSETEVIITNVPK